MLDSGKGGGPLPAADSTMGTTRASGNVSDPIDVATLWASASAACCTAPCTLQLSQADRNFQSVCAHIHMLTEADMVGRLLA